MTADDIQAIRKSIEEALPAEEAARLPEFSDEALALRFARLHADELRYVAAWSRWMLWDRTRWAEDRSLRAVDLARAVCRQASSECNTPRPATAIASASTVMAVERLARADRRLAATTDQWDADPWLLNTPGGTVDLRTGGTRPARPGDFLTKITAAAPAGDCPLWDKFLARAAGDAVDIPPYLRRAIGYCLTGSTREHAMFFAHGTGANGKTVFISTIAAILGDYATTAPMETFIDSGTSRHPTEIAGLRGARLVTATETEEGRRWAESKLKVLTGGDRVAARFMRQDFFEFTPQFKLFVAGNHKPGLRSVDEAIRRRLHLIPFMVTIPPGEQDELLVEKLRNEWSGILAWAVQGCREWQQSGLAPPDAIRAATDAYLAGEDALTLWLDEAASRTPDGYETTAELFASWRAWAERAGEFVGGQKRFAQTLLDRGFQSKRQGGTGRMGFQGVALNRRDYTDEGRYGG